MMDWNPWHGCRKISEGCLNCTVFGRNERYRGDGTRVETTKDFHLPVMRRKNMVFKLVSLDNPIYVCLTSDFFIEDADKWRDYAWNIFRYRKDLQFRIITKRVERIEQCLPKNWGPGYMNVTLVCSCENQKRTDERVPILLDLPFQRKEILHEPMLESIEIERYLESGEIAAVTCGGEYGKDVRICKYDWILHTREQCLKHNVEFRFKQTGSKFIKNKRMYRIERNLQESQAQKANIDFVPEKEDDGTTPFDSPLLQCSKSPYRSSLRLSQEEIAYYEKRGFDGIRREAFDIIRANIAPAYIKNDGRQTPDSGHPIYVSQHATASCCRKCIQKHHQIPSGRKMTETEVNYIVDLNMEWLKRYFFHGGNGFKRIKEPY